MNKNLNGTEAKRSALFLETFIRENNGNIMFEVPLGVRGRSTAAKAAESSCLLAED